MNNNETKTEMSSKYLKWTVNEWCEYKSLFLLDISVTE